MKRKFYILFTVVTISLLSALSIGVNVSLAKSTTDFVDLTDLDAATKAKFDAMINAGILEGLSEDTFGMNENMNRAQFAKVSALIMGLPVDHSSKTSYFTDVKADDPANGYALPYIAAIRAAGITDGVGGGNFDPAGNVTKEQLATFLVRALGKEEEAQLTTPATDSTVSDWARGYVQVALNLDILGISSDGTFGGKRDASRELLTLGSFETARVLEATKPLEVSGVEFVEGNKLHLTLTASVDANSVDLSKVIINGVPLDPILDSYELSEDKKTIIIKLHEGFQLDSTKTPTITVNGLMSIFGNEVKSDESKVVPVKITVPPVNSTIPVIPEPVPTPTPEFSIPIPEETPNLGPNPEPGQEPEPGPNPEPNPNPEPGQEPEPEPNPNS